jgi:hypothetical protein
MSNGSYSKPYYHRERGAPVDADVFRRLVCDRSSTAFWYLNKTGYQWRMIPPTFGNWSTIYDYFKRRRRHSVWAVSMEALSWLE